MFDVAELCGDFLGVTPPADTLKGSAISIRWLCDQLFTPTPDVDEVTLEWSARGFILALIGSFLFADKKGVHIYLCFLLLLRDLMHIVTYSWGGAVLSQLYRELCCSSLDRRCGISGSITLLQGSITLFYYIQIHIQNTSLVFLIFVYFVFRYGLGRDFMLGDQQHIQYLQSVMPYMMTTSMLSMEM